MNSIDIICDGSSLNNGRENSKAAAAALICANNTWTAVGQFLGNKTNQQAELLAAILALESIERPSNIRLVSDSEYLIKTMQGQFRKKSNLDLWARLDQVSAKHHIQWNWTRGHADHPVHNECDRAARAIAKDEVQKNAVLERAVRNVIALQRASI